MEKILIGAEVHVDETEVKLKTGKGHVWAFSSLEDVVCMYVGVHTSSSDKGCQNH